MQRARAQGVLREIKRKTVSVIEFERDASRQGATLREMAGCVVKDRQATRESVEEPGLFEAQGFDDERFGAQKLGVGLAHFARKRWNEPPHHRFLGPEHLSVAHGTTHDPTQDVAAPLVRG